MKPKYWNKGKAFLSKKDKVLKRIMETFPPRDKVIGMFAVRLRHIGK